MRLNNIKNKAGKTIQGIAGKAKEGGSKAAELASESLKQAQNKAQEIHHDARLAFYNPLFPDEFYRDDFDIPNMIVIVDEDERKGIDVCEGAIGWLSREGKVEVLHLYSEAAPKSNLKFFPFPNCDAIYYVDHFDRDRFVNLNCFHEVMEKEKLTELRNIAHALGAKKCRLEVYETEKEISIKKKKGGAKAKAPTKAGQLNTNGSASLSSEASSSNERSIVFEDTFEGGSEPKRPALMWYRNDPEILSLIEMRMSDNPVKKHTVKLDSKTSSTMSVERAAKLDVALKKLGASGNFTLESEAQSEARKQFYLYMEF